MKAFVFIDNNKKTNWVKLTLSHNLPIESKSTIKLYLKGHEQSVFNDVYMFDKRTDLSEMYVTYTEYIRHGVIEYNMTDEYIKNIDWRIGVVKEHKEQLQIEYIQYDNSNPWLSYDVLRKKYVFNKNDMYDFITEYVNETWTNLFTQSFLNNTIDEYYQKYKLDIDGYFDSVEDFDTFKRNMYNHYNEFLFKYERKYIKNTIGENKIEG